MHIILTWSEVTVSQPQSLTETLSPEHTCEYTYSLPNAFRNCVVKLKHIRKLRGITYEITELYVCYSAYTQCQATAEASSRHTLPLH